MFSISYQEYECGTCGKEFPSGSRARDQHCASTGHYPTPRYECDRCERSFRTHAALDQHRESKNHFQFECHQCYDTFSNEQQRKEHEADDHYLCAECDRSFDSHSAVHQHLRSRIHLGTSILCPFCSKGYTTATGVTHHIERGSCPRAANMNRTTLAALVRANDPSGVISKKLIGWHDDTTPEASEWAWNGTGYECFYLCHRSFGTLKGLNQHLASPVHQQALYHCPNTRCAKDFSILAGLINHLESETCGAMRFSRVQSSIESLTWNGLLM